MIPETGVPSELLGYVLHVRKPSLCLAHRDANTYSTRSAIGCETSSIKRDQDIQQILDDKDRMFVHYFFVFPFPIDHRLFNDRNDEDLEVHRFNVSVVLDATNESNKTPHPLIELTVAWRVGKFGATKTSRAQKPAIDYNALIS